MIRKRTNQKVGSPKHRDGSISVEHEPIEALSPLTSAGGDSPRGFQQGSEQRQVITVYPVLPQTLRDSETSEDGCRGLVAEPMN